MGIAWQKNSLQLSILVWRAGLKCSCRKCFRQKHFSVRPLARSPVFSQVWSVFGPRSAGYGCWSEETAWLPSCCKTRYAATAAVRPAAQTDNKENDPAMLGCCRLFNQNRTFSPMTCRIKNSSGRTSWKRRLSTWLMLSPSSSVSTVAARQRSRSDLRQWHSLSENSMVVLSLQFWSLPLHCWQTQSAHMQSYSNAVNSSLNNFSKHFRKASSARCSGSCHAAWRPLSACGPAAGGSNSPPSAPPAPPAPPTRATSRCPACSAAAARCPSAAPPQPAIAASGAASPLQRFNNIHTTLNINQMFCRTL